MLPLSQVHSFAVLGGGGEDVLPPFEPAPPQPEASREIVRVKIGSAANGLADRLFRADRELHKRWPRKGGVHGDG